jgi:hypothetical protein
MLAAGLSLIEMRERLVDDRWIALKPSMGTISASSRELRRRVAEAVIANEGE